ncbi:MAG: TIGR04282 family arsenosugar biosynthesis glycosyltransferase [Leptospira sp.]|nr:TIGR04282 family arsenosugar biosynthesis glycosyltransferase [Leptospira sp.]
MDKEALIIFAKNPILGKVKTRLASKIGDKHTLTVYLKFLEMVNEFTIKLSLKKAVYWADGIPTDQPFPSDIYSHHNQVDGDLGLRMWTAFNTEFETKDRVCIIGTDCIELSAELIEISFLKLKEYDLVIGPAMDGGYYLLGTKNNYIELFENMEWSVPSVLDITLDRASQLNLSVYLLPTLRDVDTLEDLMDMKNKFLID